MSRKRQGLQHIEYSDPSLVRLPPLRLLPAGERQPARKLILDCIPAQQDQEGQSPRPQQGMREPAEKSSPFNRLGIVTKL